MADSPISWPSFQGTATLVGESAGGRVCVYYDASLGAPALENAKDLLSDAGRVVQANDHFFGTDAGSVNVILFALGGRTDGTGGADHMACNYSTGGDIEVCVAYGEPLRVSALFEAELSECAMQGNLCGVSTGEALSRWCAAIVSNDALKDFASAPAWFDDGMPNWVDQTDPSDQDYDSIGCGIAFISWLLSKGHPLAAIAQKMIELGAGGTLAQLYGALGEHGNAWNEFSSAVKALSGGVTSDDPFGGFVHAMAFPRAHRLRLRPPAYASA